jgi:hypothetical protein
VKRTLGKPTTLTDIIETTIVMLAKHSLVNGGSGIRNTDGSLFRVVKYRDFGGVEVKQRGLTLSVFPYDYEGGSRPTPDSTNTSVSFKAYGLGGPDPANPGSNYVDTATANIKIRLDYLAYTLRMPKIDTAVQGESPSSLGSNLSVQQFEYNDGERLLRQYLEYIRLILTTDLYNLGGLVQSSFVNWYNLPTTKWDSGSSLIIHSAELMWQVYYNPLRAWKIPTAVRGIDTLLGTYRETGAPVFYLTKHDMLMTGFGQAILTTPSGIPINYDPANRVLVNSDTKVQISSDALKTTVKDTAGNTISVPFIDTNLLPIGVIQSGDIPVYFDKTALNIVRLDGTSSNLIPGPKAKLKPTGELDTSNTTDWISVKWNPTNNSLVYSNGLNVDKPVISTDLIDPSTGKLYLITGNVLGVTFDTTPPIREFLIFNSP